MPGRSLTPAEEDALAAWKEGLHRPIVRCLASNDRDTKIAAINTLGYLPVDVAAAPAVAYLEDESADVRRQVLISFAGRPNILTVDMLLKRLHDADEGIRDASKSTLKVRGLSDELISLGGLLTSPKADQRASVIALVKDRTDIDPIVWLLQLSRDDDESVRLHAVEALAAHKPQTVTIKRRIIEMARSDASSRVSEAAGKLLTSPEETTAALPPLPGSSLLNPKAN
jgi:HEAT repeat protein